MTKIVLDSIGSNYASTTKINENFQKLQDELNNKVHYRDNPEGVGNSLSSDLDLDSNDILNAKSVNTAALLVDGIDYAAYLEAIKSGSDSRITAKIERTGDAMVGPLHVLDDASAASALPRNTIEELISRAMRITAGLLPLTNTDYGYIYNPITDSKDYGSLL